MQPPDSRAHGSASLGDGDRGVFTPAVINNSHSVHACKSSNNDNRHIWPIVHIQPPTATQGLQIGLPQQIPAANNTLPTYGTYSHAASHPSAFSSVSAGNIPATNTFIHNSHSTNLQPAPIAQRSPLYSTEAPDYTSSSARLLPAGLQPQLQLSHVQPTRGMMPSMPYVYSSNQIQDSAYTHHTMNIQPNSGIPAGIHAHIPSPFPSANLIDFPPLQPFQGSSQAGPTYTPSTQHQLLI